MRVVKPNQVSLLSRPFEHENRYSLCVAGLVLLPFAEPRYPMTEAALWTLAGKELGDLPLDEAMPKRRGEILLRANAYAPGGKPSGVVRAAVDLDGKLLKEVAVVGDRVWKGSVPTPPEPFVTKPILWENAFGGEGFAPNPHGKGFQPKEGSPLPSVEDPKNLLTSMRKTPDPVSFAPLDVSRAQRLSKAGTYDQEWLDKLYPGLAKDLDWGFYNLAPADQQIAGFFRGDEELVMHNLHPEKSELRTRLPGVQMRCFLRRKPRSGPEVDSEVPMVLDTVWLFPHVSFGIVVFHGTARVREDDASDVTHLFMACEDLGAPKQREHYDRELVRRLSKEHGAIAALDDAPLLPALRGGMKKPPTPYDEMEAQCAIEQLSYQNLNRKGERAVESARELLRQHGLDPDRHGPPPMKALVSPSSIEESVRRMDEMEKEAEEQRRVADQAVIKAEAEIKKLCEEAGLDFEDIQREWRGPHVGGPPAPTAEKDLARMRQLAEDSRAVGFDASEIDDYLADPAFVAMVREQDKARLLAYRMGAQDQAEPVLRDEAESRALREEILAAHARGESLAGRDMTGADLSGIDLRGANLEEALMERCDLSNADLTGANLQRAVLVRASLRGAHLDACNLESANLSKAYCANTTFAGSRFNEAMLFEAHFVNASLDGATLERAILGETKLDRCSMRRVRADGLMLSGLDLSGTSFVEAVLTNAVFMKCTLDRADFTGANLGEATFFGCRAAGAVFNAIEGKSLRVVQATDLSTCLFREANLEQACFRGTALERTDFTSARAMMADFSECDLQDACLYHLRAAQARFVRTDLSRANMVGADLLEALLSKAIVCGTDLRGANLYQADMALARGDGETRMEEALQVRVRTRPRWTDKIQDLD